MSLDLAFFHFLNNFAGQSYPLDATIIFFAQYLAYATIALFVLLVLFSAYKKIEKIEMLSIVFFSSLIARFGVTELIRVFVHRPRPFIPLDLHPLVAETSWSFPSGHATFFFAMATAVYLYHPRWGTLFFILAFCISLGRIAAGVHYPSDILGGAVVGSLVAYGVYRLVSRIEGTRAHITY